MGDIEPELMAKMMARTQMASYHGDDAAAIARAEAEARDRGEGVYELQDNSAIFAGDIKTRDEDGTVDRVRDPPEELWPVLAALREKAKVERVKIECVFTEAGADHFGTMATTRFISSLCINFPRFKIEKDILRMIIDAYGVGFKTPVGQWESIAWMDFCEDVNKAKDTTPQGTATKLAHCRSAWLSFENLAKSPEELIDL